MMACLNNKAHVKSATDYKLKVYTEVICFFVIFISLYIVFQMYWNMVQLTPSCKNAMRE